jgi:integrase
MARTVKDAALQYRESRDKLPQRTEPFYRAIDDGRHLGYRKNKSGGAWLARRRNGEGGYSETKLGTADDVLDADGVAVLSFTQAQAKARAWFEEQDRVEAGEDVPSGPYSVAQALDNYLDWYRKKGASPKALGTTNSIAEHYIRPVLGAIEVARLKTKDIETWLTDIASSPAKLRTSGLTKKERLRPVLNSEQGRARKSTANRALNVLKAVLNKAFNDGKVAMDAAWRRAKPFMGVDKARLRFLSALEAQRLVNACPPDFRALVVAALLTGARYQELARLQVRDVVLDTVERHGSIFVAESKTGKTRHIHITDEGFEHFRQMVTGRAPMDIVFTRADGSLWKDAYQTRPLILACKAAQIEPISFHGLRHTYASWLVNRGVKLQFVADQLGHSDTRMVSKHYGHLARHEVREALRGAINSMGLVSQSNLAAIR